MTALKYSRQRESIKDYLMHTNAHPTADMVYLHVKEQFPNISLGTVYRNLNLLSDMGEIIKIPTPDGADRFDGRTVPHYHFFCTECGCMKDMNMECIRQINQIDQNFSAYSLGRHIDYSEALSSYLSRSPGGGRWSTVSHILCRP